MTLKDKKEKLPPVLAEWILRKLSWREYQADIQRDLREEFRKRIREYGWMRSWLWYWLHVLRSFLPFIKYEFIWKSVMLKNYLMIAVRNIRKHKGYTFINLIGLAVGISLFILAVQHTAIHTSYDRFHSDADRIYALVRSRLTTEGSDYHTMKIPAPVLPMMDNTFSTLEDATRFFHESGRIVRRAEKKFYEDRVWYADPNFFSFFSFELISGDPETVLEAPNSVVITESMALKYFGVDDPVGQTLTINRGGITELMVTGVCRNVPVNSSLQFDFLVSASTFEWMELWDEECTAFIKLVRDSNPLELEEKLPAFVDSRLPVLKSQAEQLTLFPLTSLHLHSFHILHHFGLQSQHPIQLFLVLGTGVVMLLIVCVNFMNLSAAMYMTRIKEVGLRKVVGASRFQLIHQFLGEAVLLSFFALLVAFLLYEFIRPTFLSYVGLNVNLSIWKSPMLIITLLAVTLGVGLTAGSYPALFLSAFKPVSIFKDHTSTGTKGGRVKKVLVVAQFTLSVLLIVFSLTMRKQFLHLSRLDLGYDRSHVSVLEVHPEMFDRLEILKQKLMSHPEITAAGGANGEVGIWGHEEDIKTEGMSDDDAFPMKTYHVDYGLIEALDMKVTRGRSFSRQFDDTHAYILSEMAVKRLGWREPVGKKLHVGGQEGTVVGVVGDFHFQHVFFKKEPAVLYLQPGWTHHLFIRLTSPPDGSMRPFVEQQWRSVAPDFPFEFYTLEQAFQTYHRPLIKVSDVFRFIGIVSLFVSCLGLIGIASFTAERKTKEIGIRKVLGASVPSLLQMLISEFIFIVVIANCIAIPIALIGSHLFLKGAWVEQTTLDPFLFVIASSLSFAAAMISVTYQSLKAAIADPVDTLRYE
jgi:putative ABC transport system permease protein